MTGIAAVQWIEIVPAYDLSPWQNKAIIRLFQIAALPSNWDSYGSPSPLQRIVDIAQELLLDISSNDVPVPEIFSVSGGGIQIEWTVERRELELEILPDGKIEFLQIQNDQLFKEGVITPPISVKIQPLLIWLLQKYPY